MPIVGVNYRQHILHMSKIMVRCYTKNEIINLFVIGYMINPLLKFNNIFRIKVEKYLSISFSSRKMKNIKNFMVNNNACVMALILIYENNGY